jgi:hypothetical protein
MSSYLSPYCQIFLVDWTVFGYKIPLTGLTGGGNFAFTIETGRNSTVAELGAITSRYLLPLFILRTLSVNNL